MVSNEYSEAVVEVLDILKYTKKEDIDKIPSGLLEFFNTIKSKTYKSNIDHSKPLREQDIKPKTRALIAMLYRNYWCSVKERKDYDRILTENYKKHQEILKEKYNTKDLFKSRNHNVSKESIKEISLIPVKNKNIIIKIFEKIKSMIKR